LNGLLVGGAPGKLRSSGNNNGVVVPKNNRALLTSDERRAAAEQSVQSVQSVFPRAKKPTTPHATLQLVLSHAIGQSLYFV